MKLLAMSQVCEAFIQFRNWHISVEGKLNAQCQQLQTQHQTPVMREARVASALAVASCQDAVAEQSTKERSECCSA